MHRRKIWSGTLIVGVLSLAFASPVATAASDVQQTAAGHTKQAILEKWQQYMPLGTAFDYMDGNHIYEALPSLTAPYKAGKLKQTYIMDGIRAVNFVRYLAGVPDDVVPDWSLEQQEQTAALVNAVNDRLSHTPSQPAGMDDALYKLGYSGTSSSNLYMGDPTLYSNVLGYMSDSDSSNIDRVGHRRWIINPAMTKTMMGFVRTDHTSPYASLYAFDRERPKSEVSYSYVSWPAAGNFPKEVFNPDDAWSVSLNPELYDAKRTSEIKVSLTRKSDGRAWSFNNSDTDKTGRYFNVEKSGFGIPFCVIFRPDGIQNLAENGDDAFAVRIDGLYDRSGNATNVSFDTNFFSLMQTPSFRTHDIKLQPGESVRLQTYPAPSGEFGGYAAQISSDHPATVTVDGNGRLQALKSGRAEISYTNYFEYKDTVYVEVSPSSGSDRVSGWAQGAYAKAKGNGLIPGRFDSDYQAPVNRYEMASLMVNLYENVTGKTIDANASSFQDISDSAVSKAVASGLMTGTAPGKFSPWTNLTRQEAASLLVRANGKLSIATGTMPPSTSVGKPFLDDAQIAAWAKPDVYKAVSLGLMSGVGAGKFGPKASLTHEQAYVMLEQLFEQLAN